MNLCAASSVLYAQLSVLVTGHPQTYLTATWQVELITHGRLWLGKAERARVGWAMASSRSPALVSWALSWLPFCHDLRTEGPSLNPWESPGVLEPAPGAIESPQPSLHLLG